MSGRFPALVGRVTDYPPATYVVMTHYSEFARDWAAAAPPCSEVPPLVEHGGTGTTGDREPPRPSGPEADTTGAGVPTSPQEEGRPGARNTEASAPAGLIG